MHTDLALTPILAEVDFSQVIFVIVFLVVMFLNWVINLWKQKNEAAERARHLPTQEETDARHRAWEEQTKRVETPPPSYPQPSPAPSSGGGSLKDLFEELKRAAQEAHAPSSPPPMPAAPRPVQPPVHTHRPHVAPPLPVPVPVPVSVPAHERSRINVSTDAPLHSHAGSANLASHAYDTEVKRRKGAHPLTALLHTSLGYQQAFILKEILDTPKGIRNTPWDNDPS
jgi:cbb3-type cytochrome oxidase subunit 3